jgi:hypothetical protein
VRVGIALLVALVLAGSAQAATRYRVASLTASAKVVFDSGDVNTFVRGSSTMQLRATRGGIVSLSFSGGHVATAIRGQTTEQVRLGSRSDVTQPYAEEQCRHRRAVTGRGGLDLRRSARGRLQVRWALPHAAMSFCPGPRSAVPRALASRMVTTIAARRIGSARLVLRLSGRAALRRLRVNGEPGTGTYTWRATITLVRA